MNPIEAAGLQVAALGRQTLAAIDARGRATDGEMRRLAELEAIHEQLARGSLRTALRVLLNP